VITQNAVITLKGPVCSDLEKQAVETKVAEVAGGTDKLKSEIEASSKQAGEKRSAKRNPK
jgi:hypothetical protein